MTPRSGSVIGEELSTFENGVQATIYEVFGKGSPEESRESGGAQKEGARIHLGCN